MRLGKLATFAVVAVGLWLGSGASAHAQTACQVDLEHVPADVSEAITSWVSAEPRCAVALSVRVVPTDGGLYVVATDANGGVRERVVPDAETAAVLVASWAADDAGAEPRTDIVEALSVIGPPEPTRVRLRPVRSRLTPAAYTGGDEVDGGPGNAPGRRRGAGLDRMVTVGFTTAKHLAVRGVPGIHVDVDLLRWWRVKLGAIAALNKSYIHELSDDGEHFHPIHDFLLGPQLASEARLGRVSLRATLGGGYAVTRITHMQTEQTTAAPFVDALVTIGARVTDRIEVSLGLQNTYVAQPINIDYVDLGRALEPRFFLGLGYRRD